MNNAIGNLTHEERAYLRVITVGGGAFVLYQDAPSVNIVCPGDPVPNFTNPISVRNQEYLDSGRIVLVGEEGYSLEKHNFLSPHYQDELKQQYKKLQESGIAK